jgi:hypothetical protein
MLLKLERIEAVSDPMRTHECPKAYLYLLGAVDDRPRKAKMLSTGVESLEPFVFWSCW